MSTFQQLLYHVVFSTKGRRPLLNDGFRERVLAYMAGVCKGLRGEPLIVNGAHDHAHLLVHIPAKIAVSDFIGRLKSGTSRHINKAAKFGHIFQWQDGYGAFSVSMSQKGSVYRYIEGQLEHHKTLTFQEELLKLLKKHELQYDPRFIWD